MTRTRFALVETGNSFRPLVIAVTREELDEKITQLYWNRAMMMPKGTTYSKTEFMMEHKIVKMTVEFL
jgi:hypothetical protein